MGRDGFRSGPPAGRRGQPRRRRMGDARLGGGVVAGRQSIGRRVLLTSAFNTTVLGLAGLGVLLGMGTGRPGFAYGLAPAGVAVLALAFFLALPRLHAPAAGRLRGARLRWTLHRLGTWVRDTKSLILEHDWRLFGTAAYLLCDIAVLWACLRAVGVAPPLLALVVGYQLGYLANLLPVPGGIGVLEGGLLAALLLYGLPVSQTAAAVILYHAIALWIPTIGGTIGFARLRRSIAERGGPLVVPGAEDPPLGQPSTSGLAGRRARIRPRVALDCTGWGAYYQSRFPGISRETCRDGQPGPGRIEDEDQGVARLLA